MLLLLSTGCVFGLLELFNQEQVCDTALDPWYCNGDTSDPIDPDRPDVGPFEPYAVAFFATYAYDGTAMTPYNLDGAEVAPIMRFDFAEERFFQNGGQAANRCSYTMGMEVEGNGSWGTAPLYGTTVRFVDSFAGDSGNTCNDFDPAKWGAETPGEYLEGWTMGLGLDVMSVEGKLALETFYAENDLDWTEVEPFVMGGIVAFEVEGGWNPVFDQETYVFELDEEYAFVYDETGNPIGRTSEDMAMQGALPAQSLVQEVAGWYYAWLVNP
jgi:hypothetical protein